MDFTKNIDKVCESGYDLYNSVLDVQATVTGTESLTATEVKLWGKIEQDTDDDLIDELIIAAREVLEDFVGLGFVVKDLVVTLNNSNGGFKLPYGPVIGDPVGADMDGVELELNYKLGRVETLGLMTVTYSGGYEVLPKKFKVAIKEQFLFMYENRGESNVGLSPMAKMLLEPVRQVV